MSQLSNPTRDVNKHERPLDPTRDAFMGWNKPLSALGQTHFIGIGGAGMSVLAQMLKEAGLVVTGSDRQASNKTQELEQMGIPVALGHDAANVENAETVVWSSAIKPDNPEIVAARTRGALLVHRSDILALLLSTRKGVTVAGAHGKTTTSALLAHILSSTEQANLADPSYAIGGSIQTTSGLMDGGHFGTGDVLVAEADESDGSFEKYRPNIAIITNVEADHLDHYGSAEAFHRAFAEHARHARKAVIICGDDAGARTLIQELKKDCHNSVFIYTTAAESVIEEMGWDVWAHVVRIDPRQKGTDSEQEHFQLEMQFQLLQQLGFDQEEENLSVKLAIPGIHNVRNAAAAIVAAVLLGMDPKAAAEAAASFRGAARRFEIKGEQNGVTVIDDYAHHPTEIAALLAAAQRRYPQAHVHVLFQPHLFSRTKIFAEEFAQALAGAEDVVITGVYPAREKQADFPDVGPQTIVNAQQSQQRSGVESHIEAIEDMSQAAKIISGRAQPGDVILTVGAGDVTSMGSFILQELENRTVSAVDVQSVQQAGKDNSA